MKDALGHGSDPRNGGGAPDKQVPAHQTGVQHAALTTDASELKMYGDNHAGLYNQSFMPVINNLQKKMDKGVYDSGAATKLWGYHADRVAQAYHKQYGSPGTKWHEMFPPATRRQAAGAWEREQRTELEHGNYKPQKVSKDALK